MQETTKYLCENIQGCVLGYTQSDEITLILVDYKKLTSSAWFDYEVQKICSITASMATMAFNKLFEKYVDEYRFSKWDGVSNYEDNAWEYIQVLLSAVEKGAMFDARCFNIPKEEVTNLLYWRQDDAAKNSIQMVGRAFFSHKELHKKSRNDIQDMLMTQKGINWNDFPTYQKRGSCCIKTEEKIMEDITIIKNRFGEDGKKHVVNMKRPHWIIDTEIPIFKGEGREYIDRLVFVGEE